MDTAALSNTAPKNDTKANDKTDAQSQAPAPIKGAIDAAKGHLGGGKAGEQAGGKAVEGAGTAKPADTAKKPTPSQSAGDVKEKTETGTKPAAKPAAKKDDAKATGGKPADAKKDDAKKDDAKKGDGGTVLNDTSSKAGDIQPAGDKPAEPLILGAAKVKVTTMTVLSRGGLNTTREEEYPFTAIGYSTLNAAGQLEGPSFFIPEADNPDQKVATARKRFRGTDIQIVTRKNTEVVEGQEDKGAQKGVRVWKTETKLMK